MKRRDYRHGLNKYKLTKEYVKIAIIFVLSITAVLLALTAFFYFILSDGEKAGNGYIKFIGKTYITLFGPAYTLALPFLCAEANMKCPRTKCWGNYDHEGWVVLVVIWGAFYLGCLWIKDEWAWLLLLVVAIVASDKFLESSANLYDLVEYIEAVSIATGEKLEYKPGNTNEQTKYQLDCIVKRCKEMDTEFEPVYLQDLEGESYERAKAYLRVTK